jgi:cytohesin
MNRVIMMLAMGFVLSMAQLSMAGEIHDAAMRGDSEKVRSILQKDPSLVNLKDEHGWTPLCCASLRGLKTTVIILLANGAKVNDSNTFGWTPLHLTDSVEIARLLIAAGADVNAKDCIFNPPLYYANSREIAELLIAKGAMNNDLADSGHSRLNTAAMYGRIDIIEHMLVNGADINSRNDFGATPLHLAAWDSTIETVAYLISHGADVNVATRSGGTPLSSATQSRLFTGYHPLNSAFPTDVSAKKRIVDFLITRSAEIHNITEAIAADDVEKVTFFIKKDPGLINHLADFQTALHCAAFWGRRDVALFLLNKGAKIDAYSCQGTPLHVSSMVGSREVTELLIARGADIDRRDRYGETPLYRAVKYGCFEMLSAYDDPRAPMDHAISPVKHSKKDDFVDVVKLLITAGADVNIQPEFSSYPDNRLKKRSSPLHLAAEKGWNDMVELLLEHGADMDARDWKGWTLLRLAIKNGHRETAEILRKHGARE